MKREGSVPKPAEQKQGWASLRFHTIADVPDRSGQECL